MYDVYSAARTSSTKTNTVLWILHTAATYAVKMKSAKLSVKAALSCVYNCTFRRAESELPLKRILAVTHKTTTLAPNVLHESQHSTMFAVVLRPPVDHHQAHTLMYTRTRPHKLTH